MSSPAQGLLPAATRRELEKGKKAATLLPSPSAPSAVVRAQVRSSAPGSRLVPLASALGHSGVGRKAPAEYKKGAGRVGKGHPPGERLLHPKRCLRQAGEGDGFDRTRRECEGKTTKISPGVPCVSSWELGTPPRTQTAHRRLHPLQQLRPEFPASRPWMPHSRGGPAPVERSGVEHLVNVRRRCFPMRPRDFCAHKRE